VAPSSPEEAEARAATQSIDGSVVEVIQVSAYTYLRLEKSGEAELWVAVSKADVKEGQRVRVTRAERMENFSSKQLGRTFPVIYFGMLGGGGAEEATANPHGGESPHGALPGQRSGRGDLAEMVKITAPEKAEGERGHRISDLFAKKDELADKKIRVRATVVQVTMNVMGTNFVHIRDGSGSAPEKTHDLVLKVAKTPPSVGEQALFEGTLKTGVDLGAGYTYSVLIEDAAAIDP
jgi:hypothetical protein